MRRPAVLAGAVWGTAMLFCAPRVTRVVAGREPTPGEIRVARILGARHVLEAAAVAGWGVRTPAVLTEVVHAGSMLALAAASPTHRRPAMASAAVAALLAVLTAESGKQ